MDASPEGVNPFSRALALTERPASIPAHAPKVAGPVSTAHRTMNIKLRFGLFALLGGGAGYAYHHFIGCQTGGCAITSNPLYSIIYGAMLGFMASAFIPTNSGKAIE